MELDAITVKLDLVDPAIAARNAVDLQGEHRLNEARETCLDPIAIRFGPLDRA